MCNPNYLLENGDRDWWSLLSADQINRVISIRDYMLGEGRLNPDPDVTLEEMSSRFLKAGVPLERCATIVRILHSINAASVRVWERESGTQSNAIPYQSSSDGMYQSSPSALAHRTESWVRFNPQKTPYGAFGIVEELRESEITDYICAPTKMVNGLQNVFTFATKAPLGFSFENIAVLQTSFPAIEACQEILVTHRILKEVTRIYVGEEPHRRILGGDVHRGEVTRLKAAILFADMRDFTSLTADMEAEDATAFLNTYYDCVVPAIEGNQGEVLKFIGDGILAMFRAEDQGIQACESAIVAARSALEAVNTHNFSGEQKFNIGIALHIGEVAYGNIGSGERLDYTVIGKDVNLTSRIADLCGRLEQPLLISSAFRDLSPDNEVVACGEHRIKGLKNPEFVFGIKV